jgi:hypothetical protein
MWAVIFTTRGIDAANSMRQAMSLRYDENERLAAVRDNAGRQAGMLFDPKSSEPVGSFDVLGRISLGSQNLASSRASNKASDPTRAPMPITLQDDFG